MTLKDLRGFVFENYYKQIGFTKECNFSVFFREGIFFVEKSEI